MLPPNIGGYEDASQAVLPAGPPANGHNDHGALVPMSADVPALAGGGWLQATPQRPKSLSAGPDVFALVNAARRRLPLALGVGATLGALLGLAVWILVPRDAEVKAYLHVSRQDPKVFQDLTAQRNVDIQEFEIVKQTISAWLQNPFVINAALKKPGIASLGIISQEQDQIKYLQETVKVMPSESEVMEISLTAADGEEAAHLLNAVVDALIYEASEKRNNEKSKRLRDLEQARTTVERNLRKNAATIDSLRQDLGTASPEQAMQKHQFLMMVLRELYANERTLRGEILTKDVEAQQLRLQLEHSEQPSVPEMLVENQLAMDPDIRNLMAEKAAAQQYLHAMEAVLADDRQDDPKLDQIRAKIANLDDLIETRKHELRPAAMQNVLMSMSSSGISPQMIAAEIRRLEEAKTLYETQLKELTEQKTALENDVAKVGKVSGDLERFQAEHLTLQEHFKKIDNEMLVLQGDLQAPSRVTLLQQATAPKTADWKLRIAMVGFTGLLGFCAGLAGIALWEFQSRRVSASSDISEGLGLRLVGSIPTLSVRSAKKLNKGGGQGALQNMVAESINSIRTTLLHGAGHEETRVVMVTSATHSEAKTTLATQLAASIARAGRRTLLIDGDLRSPSAHRHYELSLEPGLADVLRSDLELNDVIRPTRANGLWMISAGQSDPEAVEALARSIVREAFDRLRNEFDFIIIDAGPVLPIADTLLLGQNVDTAILSVLRDQSQMPKVYEAYERLKAVGIPVLGAVISGVSTAAHERARPVPMMAAAL